MTAIAPKVSNPVTTHNGRIAPRTRGGHIILGDLRRFWRDPLNYTSQLFQEYGEIVRMRFGPRESYLVVNPDVIKYVLQDNNRNFIREQQFNRLASLPGESLFTSDGEYWLQQRRLMQPTFHRQNIASFGSIMTREAEVMLGRWQQTSGPFIEVEKEMMNLAMNVVGKALFSVDMSQEAAELHRAFTTTSSYITYRLRHPFAPPLYVPTPRNVQFKRAVVLIDQLIRGYIEARRQESNGDHHDLLQMLMDARYEESGRNMTDKQIVNEAASMVFAGHETTANTLTWAFYNLSQNPQVEAKLQAELDSVLGGRTPTIEDLPKLPYNRMVIEETMRLYPPGWGISRQTIEADHLGPYTIPAHTAVFLNVYGMHRHPGYWEDPDQFEPERFTPERVAARPRFAYLPFGGGPRQCIGNLFAMTEAQLVLATVVQRCQLRLKPGHPVAPEPVFTLRTRHGLPMTAHPH